MTTSNEHNNAPAVPQGEMPLSMNQFGRLVELTREHLSDNTFVYKATSMTGATCHFGVESAAKAWAKGGTVEAIKVREFKLNTTPAPSQPVTLTDEEIKQACADIYLSDRPQGSESYDIALGRAVIAALRAKGQA